MIRKIAHIVVSVWLSILLLFGSTPKEFLHQFASHKDTVEHNYPANGLVLETIHHHCDFLSFSLMPFANDIQLPYLSLHAATYFTKHLAISVNYIQRCIVCTSLRGPPRA